jgi:hypothetical protein
MEVFKDVLVIAVAIGAYLLLRSFVFPKVGIG